MSSAPLFNADLVCRQGVSILQSVGVNCCDVRVRCSNCTEDRGCILTRQSLASQIIGLGLATTSEEALDYLKGYIIEHRNPVTFISGLTFTQAEIDREPKALIPVDQLIDDLLGPHVI